MRDPHRQRDIELGVALLVAWPAFVAALLMPDDGPRGPPLVLGSLGLYGGILFLVLGLRSHATARRLDRMRRGEGVLSRWRVDAARWGEFVAECRAIEAVPGALPNEMPLPRTPPRGTYELVVSDDAIMLDGEIVPVRRGATVRAAVAVLELRDLAPAGRRMRWRALRVPIPPGAGGDVERIVRHHDEAGRAAPRAARRAGLLLGALALVLAVVLLGVTTGLRR